MIFSIPMITFFLSSIFTLSEGDLIFTGTPEGVSPLNAGDIMSAKIEDWASLSLSVVIA